MTAVAALFALAGLMIRVMSWVGLGLERWGERRRDALEATGAAVVALVALALGAWVVAALWCGALAMALNNWWGNGGGSRLRTWMKITIAAHWHVRRH